MSEILVVGAGNIGTRYAEFFGPRAVLSSVDITDYAALEAVLKEYQPKIVSFLKTASWVSKLV